MNLLFGKNDENFPQVDPVPPEPRRSIDVIGNSVKISLRRLVKMAICMFGTLVPTGILGTKRLNAVNL